MARDRFDSLEGGGDLPADLKEAIRQLSRFERLEIGRLEPSAPFQPAAPAPARPPSKPEASPRLACIHCGQPNEAERETCWACHRFVRVQSSEPGRGRAQISLVIDGKTFRSTDAGLPDDIRALMERIRREGYSRGLLEEWRAGRSAARPPAPAPARPQASGEVEVFRGQRVTVIRMDGKVLRSVDPDLSPEIRQIFAYLDKNGLTPALMEYLRLFGRKVKYRPSDTADPSDGDLAFWQEARESGMHASVESRLEAEDERIRSQEELARAQGRYAGARDRMVISAVAIAAFLFFLLLRGGCLFR
jgi:hypothetical protein